MSLSTEPYAPTRVGLLLYASVVAAFINMYLMQAILPVLAEDFAVSPSTASLSVSVLILGIVRPRGSSSARSRTASGASRS